MATTYSSRSLYKDDFHPYRRSERSMNAPAGQTSMFSEHYDTAQLNRRHTPGNELESKLGSQRKRVPVACDRCRKRKIKCSGDQGGGRGCLNCRNAGYDGCQFLRVQSFNTSVTTAPPSTNRSWPANRYQPYPYGSSRSMGQNCVSHPPQVHPAPLPYQGWQGGMEYSPCSGTTMQASGWNRLSYGGNYHLGHSNEGGQAFQDSPPSYMLPDPILHNHLNAGYVATMGRPAQNALWIDPVTGVADSQPVTNVSSLYPPNTSAQTQAVLSFLPGTSDGVRLLPEPVSSRVVPVGSHLCNENTPSLSTLSQSSSTGWHADTASTASIGSSHTSYSTRPGSCNVYTNPTYPTDRAPCGHSSVTCSPRCAMSATKGSTCNETPPSQSGLLSSEVHSTTKSRYLQNNDGTSQPPVDSPHVLYSFEDREIVGSAAGNGNEPRSISRSSIYY